MFFSISPMARWPFRHDYSGGDHVAKEALRRPWDRRNSCSNAEIDQQVSADSRAERMVAALQRL